MAYKSAFNWFNDVNEAVKSYKKQYKIINPRIPAVI